MTVPPQRRRMGFEPLGTGLRLHRQNHAKPGLSGHHLRVGCRRLLQRRGLDHRGNAGQGAETERGVTRRRIARQGAFELAAAEYEVHAGDLDGLRPDAEDDRDPAGTQALERHGGHLTPGGRDQNDLGTAERLQGPGGVGGRAVDVVVGAELLRELRLVGTAGNGDDLEPHVPGVLDAQVAEAADPKNGDQVAGLRR